MLIDTLIEKIKEKNNPTVVGLDPQLDFIPRHILSRNVERFGETPEAAASAFYEFNTEIIDAVCDIVPAVKPQIAMYETLGADGVRCYAQTTAYAKAKGLLVIGDIKRSDIASTASCYSSAHIGRVTVGSNVFSPFDSDFVTINPYLGSDSITPFLNDCNRYGKGLFILVKTSNPGGGLFQDLIAGEKPIYMHVADFVEKTGADYIGGYGYSSVGAVVGATYPQQLMELRGAMPHTFFLVPGYGAQGGMSSDINAAFDKNGSGAIINSSRGIIAAYTKHKDKYKETEFSFAARDSAIEMRRDINLNR